MAHSLSAKKRMRQNATRRARNRGRKRQLKEAVRQFDEVIAGGDPAKAAEAVRAVIRRVDRTAAKGTIHRNTAARKKSQLQRRLNALRKTS